MAAKRVNVSFPDPLTYELIEGGAMRAGCSIAEYLRGAGTARAWIEWARDHPEGVDMMAKEFVLAHQLVDQADPLDRPRREDIP